MRLAVEDLRVRLGDRFVLDDVSLSLETGELVGLLGPNAAGKTTLLRALAGLAPLAGGGVTIDGAEAGRLGRRERARRVAYLEQGAASEWPMTVEAVIGLGRAPHLGAWSRVAAADREAVAQAMRRCDVVHLAARAATELSGGERARVMLARALATGADILLADEPVSHLDPYHQFRIMSAIRDHADRGGTVLAALHDLTLAARFCDRIVLLADGAIAADGPPDTVLTAERLARVFSVDAALVREDGALHVVQRGVIERPAPGGERSP